MSRARLVAIGVGIVLVAGLLVGWNSIGQLVGPTCGLQIRNTDATIEVHGWSADTTCGRLATSATLGWKSGGGHAVTCSGTVDGSRVDAELGAISSAARDRLCAFLRDAPSNTGLPSIGTLLVVAVTQRAGQPIGGASTRLREPAVTATADSTGVTRHTFAGGLGPGPFNIVASHQGFTTESADFRVTKWQAQVQVTVTLGYLAPSGTFARRAAANVWDVLRVSETENGFTGTGTETSFDCASNVWNVAPVFVGRVKGKDAIRFKDFEIAILGPGALPPDWLPNGAAPDVHAPIPAGTC